MLGRLAVLPEYRRRGIGDVLQRAAERRVGGLGLPLARPIRHPGRQLLDRLGWAGKRKVVLLYVLAWVAMLLIAVANGVLRQATFAKVMPELRAHQLSTLIGSVVIGAFI